MTISYYKNQLIGCGAVIAAALAFPGAASADIVLVTDTYLTGQGFGNNPRLLSEQETAKGDDVESACVAAGGSISFGAGACISDSSVFSGNGYTNTGGDEVNPLGDNQKYGTPTIGEMGYEDASDIGLLFNATEPGGNAVDILDVTLKFYDQSGNLIAAVDGSANLPQTEEGNGVAGFLFEIDEEQQAYLNSTVFGLPNYSDIMLALESTIANAQGGPESWLAVNLGRSSTGSTGSTGGTPVPAPAPLGLLALGLGGLMLRRRERA